METVDLIDISTDALEGFLTDTEARIGQARAAQMTVLSELDRRQTPTGDGCRTLSEWVAGRLDVAPQTARQLAHTTQALVDLPVTRQALRDGHVTYDRAAQLARTTTAATEHGDLEAAASYDIAGLRRQAALRRRLTSVSEHEAHLGRALMIQPNLDESVWNLWGTLPGYQGQLVEHALHQRADQLPTHPTNTDSRAQRHADALVSIAQDSLTGGQNPDSGEPSESGPSVTVFVDATAATATNGETGAWIVGGPQVGPATLERILCEGTIEVVARTQDGQPLAIGQASRAIPPKLRRYILARDGGCTADGCTSRYRLQPHHKTPDHTWRQNGPLSGRLRHDPTNLTTLCWYHHHIVIHGQGHTIDPTSPPGRIRFHPPNQNHDPP